MTGGVKMEKLAAVVERISEGDVLCFFRSPFDDRHDHYKFVVNAIYRTKDGKPDFYSVRNPKGITLVIKIDKAAESEVLFIHKPSFVEKDSDGWHFKR